MNDENNNIEMEMEIDEIIINNNIKNDLFGLYDDSNENNEYILYQKQINDELLYQNELTNSLNNNMETLIIEEIIMTEQLLPQVEVEKVSEINIKENE